VSELTEIVENNAHHVALMEHERQAAMHRRNMVLLILIVSVPILAINTYFMVFGDYLALRFLGLIGVAFVVKSFIHILDFREAHRDLMAVFREHDEHQHVFGMRLAELQMEEAYASQELPD